MHEAHLRTIFCQFSPLEPTISIPPGKDSKFGKCFDNMHARQERSALVYWDSATEVFTIETWQCYGLEAHRIAPFVIFQVNELPTMVSVSAQSLAKAGSF